MIVKNVVLQFLQCTICEEKVEMQLRVRNNWEMLHVLVEELTADHVDCERFAHDPRLAAAARSYKVRMRRKLAENTPRQRRQPLFR